MRSFLVIIIFSLGYSNIKFIPHSLNVGEKGILSIHTADINKDGNIDLLYSSIETNSITWLENKEHRNFIPHIVSSQIRGSTSIFPTDLNGDGNINVLDVVILVDHILNPDTSELESGDINSDGNINVLDVVVLVSIILGN